MIFKELVIEASGLQNGNFDVKLRDRVHEVTRVTFDLDAWRRPLRRLEDQDLSLEELSELGKAMAGALFPEGAIRQALLSDMDALTDEAGLRIRLFLEGPQLANLPWEYVFIHREAGAPLRTGFLGLNRSISIVRDEAIQAPVRELQSRLPLKVGFGFASPLEEARLNAEKERGVVEKTLSRNERFELTIDPALSAEKMALFSDGLDIFHFAGHGKIEEKIEEGKVVGGRGVILLQDDRYGSQSFDADRLANNLRNAKLVVLGACESGRRDGVNVWSSVATVMLQAGIPAAVGMQYQITDISSGLFAEAFYASLGKGKTIDEAIIAGRQALGNQLDKYELEWGIPVLYMHSKTGNLFPEISRQLEAGFSDKEADVGRLELEAIEEDAEVTAVETDDPSRSAKGIVKSKTVKGKVIGVKRKRSGPAD